MSAAPVHTAQPGAAEATATPLPATFQPVPHAGAVTPMVHTAPQGLAQVLSSDQLLQGRPSIHIAHNGTVYRLQATRQGKLILTK
jgi:hemin uptake protein HemP